MRSRAKPTVHMWTADRFIERGGPEFDSNFLLPVWADNQILCKLRESGPHDGEASVPG
jgi:hypothetical protein